MRKRKQYSPESLLRLLEENEVGSELGGVVKAAVASGNQRLINRVGVLLALKDLQYRDYPFQRMPISGRVELGETFAGDTFGLSRDDLNQHLLAIGQSGSGKTTLFYNLFTQVDVPVWFFDLKQDYRHLAEQSEVLVLPWSELKLNPLRPPRCVSPRRWAQVFSEIFGHATALLSGSKNYLMKQIIRLYHLYGLFDEVSPPYPSLHELELLIETDKMSFARKASNYRDTVLNRLEAMNLVAGTVFDCSDGYDLNELLERDVVFEFDGLSRDVQNFLMEILFASVYESRLGLNQRGQGLQHLFFLDEGKRVFSVYKERQDAAGIPAIDELTAKMREFGEGLVVADQEASKLTDSIKANTYTKVLLPVGDRQQFDAVAGSLNLSERQRAFAQGLGTGEAIVQIGSGSPVPVKLDNYELEKNISQGELERLQAEKWASLSSTPRETTSRFDSAIAPGRSDEVPEKEIVDDPQEIELSDDGIRLLKDIVENPFRPLTERYSEFSSSYKGNKSKNELVDQGVLFERQVKTGKGRRKLLELTKKGRRYAEERLDMDTSGVGRGGIVHRYWQHRIKEAFEEAGWYAEIEVFDSDVYVNMGSSELVVEVAMGNNEREIEHVKKHLEKGFDPVWVFCQNSDIKGGLEKRLEEAGLDTERVVLRLFRDLGNEEILAG